MDFFPAAFDVLVSPADEGAAWSGDPNDPGNWTGGRVGKGILKGSKFGISAAQFPDLDIAALTRAAAGDIYRPEYWAPNRCGEMPWGWALAMFDGAVNQGEHCAGMLQTAVGVPVDGIIGPVTLAAVRTATPAMFDAFLELRLAAYRRDAGWPRYRHSWEQRLATVRSAAASPPAALAVAADGHAPEDAAS